MNTILIFVKKNSKLSDHMIINS